MRLVKDESVEFIDFRFCDLPGLMQHVTHPVSVFSEDLFEDGFGFDGSSIRGFQEIQESDMLLVPDAKTAVLDPFRQHKTLIINCFVRDPLTGEDYSRDPRFIARKAQDYMGEHRHRRHRVLRPRARVLHLRLGAVRPGRQTGATYRIESVEGVWNTGEEMELDGSPNLGYKPRVKGGYFPVPPMDHYQDLRSEMATNLMNAGIQMELHHHEVGERWSGRDRHALRHAPGHGRQAHALQVHPEEHGLEVRQDAHLHAEADLRGQRFGHAHPPVVVEGWRADLLRREGLRGPLRHRALVHRRAAASTRRRSLRSRRRRRTPTSDSSPATRRR